MTAPFTPEEWLPILTKGLDDERAARLAELKRHMDSDAPLPEMGRNLRASWQRFQKESRTNWGALIVGSVADRIVPIGVEVAGSTESSEAAHAQHLPLWRMEDGFLRSSGLGSDLHMPLSLVLDKTGIYYDARRASDLETLLSQSALRTDEHKRALALQETLVSSKLTKHNWRICRTFSPEYPCFHPNGKRKSAPRP